jgi:hypothetical protein
MPKTMTMPKITPEQQAILLKALRVAFGCRNFDTSSVVGETVFSPDLMADLKAAIPGYQPRLRHRPRRRHDALRRILTSLADQHFETDQYGWWYLKEQSDA